MTYGFILRIDDKKSGYFGRVGGKPMKPELLDYPF
jgi:hypothetical protein